MWFRAVFQGRFEIVVKIDLGFNLGGLSVSLKFTLDLFNVGVMLISGVLSVWFKMCLSFLLVWFRVDSGLGQWFIAGWFKVGAKFYLKSIQGLIRNLTKIHVSVRFGFGLVLGWVNPLFGICFKVYLRLVENSKLGWRLTLRCACSFLPEGFSFFKTYSYIIHTYRLFVLRISLGLD